MVAVLLHFSLVSPALAAGPQERVRKTVDAVSSILADPQLQGAEQEATRKQRVRALIHETFEFGQMARESLGAHWATLAPQQREEFVALFGDLFARSYTRLVLRFLGESQTVYGTESIDRNRALVRTTLVRKREDVLPVDYHLAYHGQRWAVFDVVVDGVSLARNFRVQFDRTIRSASYDALVRKIRVKLEEKN